MVQALSGERPWRRSLATIPVASPAAGADWLATVPGGHVYQLLAVYARLTTSATVANRQPDLVMTDGALEFVRVPPAAVQAASLVRTYSWVASEYALQQGLTVLGILPAIRLGAAWTVGPSTLAIDATDQWDRVRLLVIDTMVQDGSIDLADIPDHLVEVLVGPTA